MKILSLFKAWAGKLKEGLRRFPLPLFMAVLTISVFIYMNHLSYLDLEPIREQLDRLGMTFAFGIPLFLCVQVLLERLGSLPGSRKMGLYAVALALMGICYFLILRDIETIAIIRYFGISLALYLIFTLIPYWKKGEGYVLYLLKLFVSFFASYLYAIILYLGLAAILFTIDSLFSIAVPSTLYLDMWLIAAGVVAPAYFFSEIPQPGEQLSIEGYPRLIKGMISYILMPLLAIYGLILYLYFAKILLEGQWPIQQISHLVLWFSLVATLVIFTIDPLKEQHSWFKGFSRWFPPAMLPLLGMMFVAMGKRIGFYGLTENRYFVLAAGLWVILSIAYLLFKKRIQPPFFTQLLTLFILLSLLGPWSAFSAARFSQNQRLEAILNRNGMLVNSQVVPASQEIAETDRREINEILSYFNRNHHLDRVSVLPEGFALDDMEAVFGFPYTYGWTWEKNYWSYQQANEASVLNIAGYDYLINYRSYSNIEEATSIDQGLSYQVENSILHLSLQGELLYEKDLRELALEIRRQHQESKTLPLEDLTFDEETPRVKIRLLIRDLYIMEDAADKTLSLESINFDLLVKVK